MEHVDYLLRCADVSRQAREHGNTPFGAVLVGPDGTILVEQENIELTDGDCTGHAETALMRKASQRFDRDFLARCTLYSTAEPCAMCSAAIYWGNVRRVVYAITEQQLLALTGDDPRNPTMSLPCRQVFSSGQKEIAVIGPIDEAAEAVVAAHEGFWNAGSDG